MLNTVLFLCVNKVKLFLIMSLCFCNHMLFGESITSVYQINSESSWSLHVVMLVPFSFKSSQQQSHKSNRLDKSLNFDFFYFKILNWRVNRVYIYHFSWWSLPTQSCVPICSLLCVCSIIPTDGSDELLRGPWEFFLFLNFKPCLVNAALLGVINRSGRNLCKPLAGTSVQQLARYLCSQLASRHDSCLAFVSLRWASTSVSSSFSLFFKSAIWYCWWAFVHCVIVTVMWSGVDAVSFPKTLIWFWD